MAKFVPNALAVAVGGVLINAQNEIRTAKFTPSKDTSESTGSGDFWKTNAGTQAGATFTFEGLNTNSASSASSSAHWLFWNAFQSTGSQAGVTVAVYPSGCTSGCNYESATVIITNVETSHAYNEFSLLSVSGTVTGAITKGTV